ncbi:S-adenosyl-L-methionine-dependent methyltransferase [Periconia macrospinosa]|uniref:S-adenosyl-L-methionine-dependent methyltransferase n=1 Tax=Periconia macrospinosa TaxID=97972 RepID=A0A2V1DBG7_9PLEO|nr:S-adenosyl-L-methionine-dependent methyltransferase [Periconia macrospinosa]
MNNPESNKPFVPKQALAPTPQLYHQLVADGMENLAKVTVAELASERPIVGASHLLDLGCGTGAGTSAFVGAVSKEVASDIGIKGVDINQAALDIYKKTTSEQGWPAEAILGDANKMDMFTDDTFTHSLATAMVFVLPDNADPAIKEMYRTLKPGSAAALNSWAYVPNMHPLRVASRATRPAGFPEIRGAMDQWEDGSFLQARIEEAGFKTHRVVQREVFAHTTTDIYHQANMLWSFIGGTTASGWIESDEERWDEAIEIIVAELRKTDGYQKLEGDKLRLKFVAHVAVAIK